MRLGKRQSQRGMTFVAVLLLLACLMLGLALAGPAWSQQVRRERERELLRVGAMYAKAIADYHDGSPGGLKQYPQQLEALLLDKRYVGVLRHMRRLYSDPVNPNQVWGLLRNDQGAIVGVYSLSSESPVAQGSINVAGLDLPPAKRYSDWKFIAKVKS